MGTIKADSSEAYFADDLIDYNNLYIDFKLSFQIQTKMTYFSLPDVFSSIGSFFVTIKIAIILACTFLATKFVKQKIATNLTHQKQEYLSDTYEHKHECQSILTIKAVKNDQASQFKKLIKGTQDDPDEEDLIEFYKSQITRFKSIKHNFEVEQKIDTLQKVVIA